MESLLLQIGGYQGKEAPARAEFGGESGAIPGGQRPVRVDEDRDDTRWKASHGTLVVIQGQADLLQIVGALDAPRRLAGRLYRGQQERDQDGDDGDHHQKFDERESATSHRCILPKNTATFPLENANAVNVILAPDGRLNTQPTIRSAFYRKIRARS